MKYEEPTIVALNPALETITTIVLEKRPVLPEREPNFVNSAGAYEADE